MSLKARIERIERRDRPGSWEAPLFFIMYDEDEARIERRWAAHHRRYRQEIERDLARGRDLFGVDFR